MRPFDDINRLAAWPALDRVAAPACDLVNRVLTDQRLAAGRSPATAPAAAFPTRVRDGPLELRVATWPGVPAS